MNAKDELAKMLDFLKAGGTIYISTHLRTTKVTQKHIDKFEASGRPLFKATADSLYMSVGKRYDCIDWCKITGEKA